MPRPVTIQLPVGARTERLTVLNYKRVAGGGWIAECACDCDPDTIVVVAKSNLDAGRTKSCGCLQRESRKRRRLPDGVAARHDDRSGTGYTTWQGMKDRCGNPEAPQWPRYGGRGIRVHPTWAASFDAFIRDVGPKPSSMHSLDRIDNDGNYEPGNVRWALPKVQARNKSINRILQHNGEAMTLVEWSERTGLHVATIATRLRFGWSIEKTLTEPASEYANARRLSCHGKTLRVSEWAQIVGISRNAISQRLALGWPIERALTEPTNKETKVPA